MNSKIPDLSNADPMIGQICGSGIEFKHLFKEAVELTNDCIVNTQIVPGLKIIALQRSQLPN